MANLKHEPPSLLVGKGERGMGHLCRRLFSLPAHSSAISFSDSTVRYIKLIERSGVISISRFIEESSPDLSSFVTRHNLYNEIVSVSPGEEESFYKFLEKEDGVNESGETLVSEHLPKGIEGDSVSMERFSLVPSGGLLLHFLHNDASEKLQRDIGSSKLILERIGGGVCEIGITLQHFVEKDYTGAVLIIEPKICHAIIFSQGAFSDCETLHAGRLHFEENPIYFFNEVSRFLIYYWETKRIKPALKEIRLLESDPKLEEFFKSHDFSIRCINDSFIPTAGNQPPSLLVGKGERGMGHSSFSNASASVFALALNSLTLRMSAINHHAVMEPRLKNALLFQKAEVLLLRFVLPAMGAGLLLLLLFLLLFSGVRHRAEKRINAKGGEIEQTLAMREENKTLQATIHEARTLVRGKNFESGIFQIISQAMPATVWLTSIQYDRETKLTISGVSGSETAIEALYGNLEKEKRFSNVRLLFTERMDKQEIARKSNRALGQSLVRFSIEMDAP